MLFCQQTHKTHSYYYLITAELPFICTRINHVHQTKPRKYGMLMFVTTQILIIYQICHDVVCCVKSGNCSVFEPEVKSQWTILVGYLTISTRLMHAHTHTRVLYLLTLLMLLLPLCIFSTKS